MKRYISLFLACLTVLALLAGCGQKRPDAPAGFAVDTASMSQTGDTATDGTLIFTAGGYDYYMAASEDTAYMVVATEKTRSAVEKSFSADEALTRDEADALLRGYMADFFPDWKSSAMDITCRESGRPLDYFFYTLAEYDSSGSVLRTASVSIAYDGTLISVARDVEM